MAKYVRRFRNPLNNDYYPVPASMSDDEEHKAMNRVIDFDILSRQPDPQEYELTPTDKENIKTVWMALGLI